MGFRMKRGPHWEMRICGLQKGLQVVTGARVDEATSVARNSFLWLAALFRIFRLMGPLGGRVKKKGRGDPEGSVPCLFRICNHSRKEG